MRGHSGYLIWVSRTSMTTSPGRPLTSRLSRAGLLACWNSDRPKPISWLNVRRADRKPCQWNADRLKKAAKKSRVSCAASRFYYEYFQWAQLNLTRNIPVLGVRCS